MADASEGEVPQGAHGRTARRVRVCPGTRIGVATLVEAQDIPAVPAAPCVPRPLVSSTYARPVARTSGPGVRFGIARLTRPFLVDAKAANPPRRGQEPLPVPQAAQ